MFENRRREALGKIVPDVLRLCQFSKPLFFLIGEGDIDGADFMMLLLQ